MVLNTDDAVDCTGNVLRVGDAVLVRPETKVDDEGRPRREPWQPWHAEVVAVTLWQAKGARQVLLQPIGRQWSPTPVLVRSCLTQILPSNAESN